MSPTLCIVRCCLWVRTSGARISTPCSSARTRCSPQKLRLHRRIAIGRGVMKRIASGLSLAILGVLAADRADRASAQNAALPVLVIQGGTLIDGNGGAPLPNSVVVVQGNRITAVGRAGQVQV